ncbi:hypothetical protein [Paludibaculum fermentans]|uniref:Tetratricopeptide repeat protein n=1 Tax=Paludibaculum fermentans TaxID=1473598 RepID=A0A7S7SHY8_PALFE|nr:hypothetical protein [Paludibaculum fermentans]QOY85494.1 hypothetical protein IRI77_21995 [Paludibaculum fermentans]
MPVTAQQTQGLDLGYQQMYNLEFDAAHKTFAEWMRQHPEDPLGPVSNAAAYLFSEFDRLHILQSEFFLHDDNFRTSQKLKPDAAAQQAFQRELARTQELAGRIVARSPGDSNAVFAQVLALGLQSDYDALIEKRYLSSLNATKDSRLLAEKLLRADPNFADAWLAIGVENYLLSLKPLPVRWFLQWNGNATNKELGLEKLKITAEKGRFLQPFARLLLAVAALRDKNRELARTLLQSLSRQFPHNHLYAEELARLR